MREEELFLPTSTLLVDLKRVDANLGLKEGSGSRAAGEREGVVARTAVLHGGYS